MLNDIDDQQRTSINDGNSMTFVCNESPSILFQKLYEQKKSNRFCDLTLQLNDDCIVKAHRNVLACSSSYFDSILKHHRTVGEHLIVNCQNEDAFNMVLSYMYTGQITIEAATIEEILKLADLFLIPKLIEYCIEFLGGKLRLDNCFHTLFLTQRYRLKHLSTVVENWIVRHLNDICDSPEIMSFSGRELYTFFCNKNFLLSTEKTLDLLGNWIQQDLNKRESHFQRLLHCFNTDSLEPVQVFKHLETSLLYTKSDLCLFQFLDYLARNNWMLSNFKTRYDTLQIKYGSGENLTFGNDSNVIPTESDDEMAFAQLVRPKRHARTQLILKRLMLYGLAPSLRVAALKLLTTPPVGGGDALLANGQPLSEVESEGDDGSQSGDESEDDQEMQDEINSDEMVDLKCPICFTSVPDSILLEQHLAFSHGKDVTYKCGICSYLCQYNGDYLNHMKSHFPGPPYKCDFCETVFDQISKLISHRAQHIDDTLYQCSSCSFKCRQKDNYLTHLKVHEENNINVVDTNSTLVPSVSSGSTPSSIQNHDSDSEKLFKCEQCSKTFRYRQNLDAHLLTHTNNNEVGGNHHHNHHHHHPQQQQQHHENNENDPTTLHEDPSSLHHHNFGKSLTCESCGFHTKFLSHMIAHKRIHAGDVYRCSYPQCKYSTSKKGQLANHAKTHHQNGNNGARPHACTICGRGFMEKSHLVRHERIHLDEKPFKCTNCDYASSRRDKLKEHFTRHHSENASAKVPYKARPMRGITAHTRSTAPDPYPPPPTANSAQLMPQQQSSLTSNDIQDLIMHSGSSSTSSTPSTASYHHFGGDGGATDFQQINHHNLHNQMLGPPPPPPPPPGRSATPNGSGGGQQQHMARANSSVAAMMLDPRFHHNAVAAAAAAAASYAAPNGQQLQVPQHAATNEYTNSLQNCMSLF